MRKICVVIGSRAHYSSIKAALVEIDRHPDLALELVLIASAILDKYGDLQDKVRKVNSIAIHLRRCDYVSGKQTSQVHGTLDVKYYINVLDFIWPSRLLSLVRFGVYNLVIRVYEVLLET